MNLVTLDLKFTITRDVETRGDVGLVYTNDANGGVRPNCKSIERDPGGGWWIVVDAHHSYWVPDDHVVGASQRADRYSDELELPSYAERVADGFKCKQCQKVVATLHGLKTHYGSHSRE
jgi:hypothetical protein